MAIASRGVNAMRRRLRLTRLTHTPLTDRIGVSRDSRKDFKKRIKKSLKSRVCKNAKKPKKARKYEYPQT